MRAGVACLSARSSREQLLLPASRDDSRCPSRLGRFITEAPPMQALTDEYQFLLARAAPPQASHHVPLTPVQQRTQVATILKADAVPAALIIPVRTASMQERPSVSDGDATKLLHQPTRGSTFPALGRVCLRPLCSSGDSP